MPCAVAATRLPAARSAMSGQRQGICAECGARRLLTVREGRLLCVACGVAGSAVALTFEAAYAKLDEMTVLEVRLHGPRSSPSQNTTLAPLFPRQSRCHCMLLLPTSRFIV